MTCKTVNSDGILNEIDAEVRKRHTAALWSGMKTLTCSRDVRIFEISALEASFWSGQFQLLWNGDSLWELFRFNYHWRERISYEKYIAKQEEIFL